MRLSVIGTGYLGATHAACLARLGHEVVGLDVDPSRVGTLREGRAPFNEPDLDDLLREGLAAGRLRFTTEAAEIADADVHFLCVGTPQVTGGIGADLSYVWQTADMLLEVAPSGGLVAGRSTVPAGTAAALQERLRSRGAPWDVVWNPEFLREGHAVEDSWHPTRIVIGTPSDRAFARVQEIYAPLAADGVPVIRTDLATAELAKVAANAMLAARVSCVNALAEVCEAADADVHALVHVVGSDPRIGADFLEPGLGFGGGCLPKDLRSLTAQAHDLDVGDSMALFHEVDNVNMRQRSRAVDHALELLRDRPDGVRDAAVAVLGVAFKSGSDDVRDSPALDVAGEMHALGAQVRVYDPAAREAARQAHPELRYATDVAGACADADLVMVLTGWPEFARLDPVALVDVVRRPAVFDGRLVLDRTKWAAAGWRYRAPGVAEPAR